MRRLRVLFVAGLEPVPGGACGGQLTQARTLFNSGLSQVVDLVPLSSTMQSIPPPGLLIRLLAAARRAARFLRELPRVDVVLVFVSDGMSLVEKGLMCVVARLLRRGVVVRFSSGHLVRQCATSALLKWWLRTTLRSCHVTTTQGAFWTEYFQTFPEAASKVMEAGNGLVLRPRKPGERTGGKRIIFIGWVQREKGIFEALQAFARVHEAHAEAHLSIVGGGRDHADVVTTIAAMGLQSDVSTPGWLPSEEIPAALANAHVLLLPSHAEGLPNVVLEAMGAGLPVVATRVGSIPEVVEDGRSGVLVDVGDVDAMVEALTRVLADADLGRRMGDRGRRIVEERFSIERVWPVYARAIEHAAHATRRTPVSDEQTANLRA